MSQCCMWTFHSELWPHLSLPVRENWHDDQFRCIIWTAFERCNNGKMYMLYSKFHVKSRVHFNTSHAHLYSNHSCHSQHRKWALLAGHCDYALKNHSKNCTVEWCYDFSSTNTSSVLNLVTNTVMYSHVTFHIIKTWHCNGICPDFSLTDKSKQQLVGLFNVHMVNQMTQLIMVITISGKVIKLAS